MSDAPKLPWMKFYPSDWRGESCLRICSLAARGLWMEMLSVMHEAEPRGSLVMNGRAMTFRQIAALVGSTVDEVGDLVSELRDAGVFSQDADGTIYSRRMRRDDRKAREDKANGLKGGNPYLVRGDNPPLNGGHKAQRLEARDHIPDQSPPPSNEAAREEGEGGKLFEEFYKPFPKAKTDSKPKAREAFEELTLAEQRALADNGPKIAEHVRGQKLTRPYGVAGFIRDRKFEGLIAGPAVAANSGVFVREDTPPWRAWVAHRGRAPPVQNGGWYFPSEWPPAEIIPIARSG